MVEHRSEQHRLASLIDPSPFAGLFPEGWICVANGYYKFAPLEYGRPYYNTGTQMYDQRPGYPYSSMKYIGYTEHGWGADWNFAFPQRLRDSFRIVRVGPSVDGLHWQWSPDKSDAIPELFPDGVLACNRAGHVRLFVGGSNAYGLKPDSRNADWQFNNHSRSWYGTDSGKEIPSFLRCFNFPAHLDYQKRAVRVGPREARRRAIRGFGYGIVGKLIDTAKWATTGIWPEQG